MNKFNLNCNIKNIINKYTLPSLNIIKQNKKRCYNDLLDKTSLLKYCIDERKYEKIYDPGWDHKYYLQYGSQFFKIKKRKLSHRRNHYWIIDWK